jgi:hypothetical protein
MADVIQNGKDPALLYVYGTYLAENSDTDRRGTIYTYGTYVKINTGQDSSQLGRKFQLLTKNG